MLQKVQIKLDDKCSVWTDIQIDSINVYFKGSFFYKERLYNSVDACNLIATKFKEENARTREKITEFLVELNGYFGLVISFPEVCYVISDRLRSIPLFYSTTGEETIITNNLINFNSTTCDELSQIEFILTGLVSGKNTLLNTFKQLESGTFLEIKGKKIFINTYYEFTHNEIYEGQEINDLILELKATFYRSFQRLYDLVKHKEDIYLPLSGGYDSRLIALMLKEFGINNVYCYTYGKNSNKEAKISKDVANLLGYNWDFFEYTNDMWEQMRKSNHLKKYYDYSFNGVSLPHMQDFPVVKDISYKLNENSIFIPGHSGDFLGGSHITTSIFSGNIIDVEKSVVDEIYSRHYYLWSIENNSLKNRLQKRIKSNISINLDHSLNEREQVANLFEYWDWKERQSKFIVNSVRVYDFFGANWNMPLWDLELMNFFTKVPLRYRYNKLLYDQTLNFMFPSFFSKTSEKSSYLTNVKKKMYTNEIIRYISQVRIARNKHYLQWFSFINKNDLTFQKRLRNLKIRWPNHLNSYIAFDILKNKLKE
ncbi:asparagine synthase C-terminal domain-containing protein [Priestia koreensis]|uniref:asparagine synthase C-terminal domain-containing protein n=1 Tax=Priestia koreensis TaxID=284581 RepID=UPI003019C3CC